MIDDAYAGITNVTSDSSTSKQSPGIPIEFTSGEQVICRGWPQHLISQFTLICEVRRCLVGVVVENIKINAKGSGFDYRDGKIRHSVANGSPPLPRFSGVGSCFAQTLSRGDGPPRHSLHAVA